MPETKGMEIHLYLDDWAVPVPSFQEGVAQAGQLLRLCDILGLLVNFKKSELIPAQIFVHLGVRYNLITYRVSMSPDNRQTLREWCHRFLNNQALTARTWLGLIGFINSQEKLTQYGRLRLRQLQWALKGQCTPATGSLGFPVRITEEVKSALRWWLVDANIDLGAPIRMPEPSVTVQTDASKAGWGGHSGTRTFHGLWTPTESRAHINVLEMRAVLNTLQQLSPPRGSVIMVATDNTTVMSHINKQGGTRSWDMHVETQGLLLYAEAQGWILASKHVPGRLNILADQLSRRGQSIQTEWELHQEAAQALFDRWGQPLIDLFATRLNAKLPLFISPVPDPLALGVDALSVPWEGMTAYAFPPHRIIPQVLHKASQTKGLRLILVTPLWERQPWVGVLRKTCQEGPIAIPPWRTLLRQPRGGPFHPNPQVWNLHAWLLDTRPSATLDTLRQQPSA